MVSIRRERWYRLMIKDLKPKKFREKTIRGTCHARCRMPGGGPGRSIHHGDATGTYAQGEAVFPWSKKQQGGSEERWRQGKFMKSFLKFYGAKHSPSKKRYSPQLKQASKQQHYYLIPKQNNTASYQNISKVA